MIAACGMLSEARIAHGAGVVSIASPVPRVLEARLEDALAKRARGAVLGIISFGTAGALWRYYRPGHWLVAPKLIGPDGEALEPDAKWSMALLAAIPGAQPTTLVASAKAVLTPADKRALHEATGANVVDMESHVVARVAAAHGLPFAVARVVLDPLDATIPGAAMAGLLDDGSTVALPVLRALMRAPRELVPLVKIAMHARAAHKSLRVGRRAMGARMAFPDE